MPTAALALPEEATWADRANRPQHDLLHLCWHKGSFPWFQTQGWVPAQCPGPPEIKGSEIPESGHARLRDIWDGIGVWSWDRDPVGGGLRVLVFNGGCRGPAHKLLPLCQGPAPQDFQTRASPTPHMQTEAQVVRV